MQRLQDKVALITGGAGGIGEATARRFASEGAVVVVADINGERAEKIAASIAGQAWAIRFDGGDIASIRAMVDAVVAKHGRLDILHNNHALLTDGMPDDLTVVDTEFAVWDRTIDINLTGYFAACKFAIPHMIAGGGGSVINMASDSGMVANFNHISYNVSKAGVIALTMNVATHHGRQGIRCNAISPGLIVTPNVRIVARELVDLVGRHNLLDSTGEPDDIAGLAAFLASDDARFVTGQNISCDGGLIAHLPQNADHLDYIARQTAAAS